MKKKHRKAMKAAQRHMAEAFESLLRAGAILEGMADRATEEGIATYSSVTASDLKDMSDCAANHYHMMDDIRKGRIRVKMVEEEMAVH